MPSPPVTVGDNALRTRRRPLQQRLAPLILLLPAVGFILIAMGYPLLRQVIMSFQEFGLAQQFGQPAEWVWFDNYAAVLQDPYFWSVFAKSLGFCAWTAGWTMILALSFALLMHAASGWARTILNVVLVVVWAMPLLAALTIWQWLVDGKLGLLNYLLTSIGLTQFEGFSWLAANFWTFYLVASAVIIWASMPLATITIYSALTQVDGAVLEASEIDGASYLQRLVRVVLPIIAPVVSLIAVLQVIWDLRVFTHIHVLQQAGGISQQTNLLGTYVFQVGVSQGDYGTASALAMIILLLTLVITAKYLQMLFKQGDV